MADLDHEVLLVSDQKCKECRRRGAKCDRNLPQCSACVKFKRHCLYDKHSKSPLTRRHLTEVESRLEQAEALLRNYQRYGLPPSTNRMEFLQPQSPGGSDHNRDNHSTLDLEAVNGGRSSKYAASTRQGIPATSFRHAILDSEDFNWDERFRPIAFGDSRSFNERVKDSVDPIYDNEDEIALDGMAILALNDKDYGYMGSATGASFLSYLWRWPSRAASQFVKAAADLRADMECPSLIRSVDPCRVTTDPFIDAYFSTFHCIFPLVHESSFRNVYSQIVPPPAGTGWSALANMIVALGAFSAMTKCLTIDTPFYYAAKKSLSMDCLEVGNVTLVQALILMSDYLQKRNKPNSGYIYAGLARRMAYSLGMHKEFPKGNGNVFQNETRRRVWWTIVLVDCNMSMTLSRPLSAMDETTDVQLPANINEGDLTPINNTIHPDRSTWTLYSSLRAQAKFVYDCIKRETANILRICNGVQDLYTYSISNSKINTQKLMRMDDNMTRGWLKTIPLLEKEEIDYVSGLFALASAIPRWKLLNFRIIIYRPFLFEDMMGPVAQRTDSARNRCLCAAHEAIVSTSGWWALHQRTRIAAWHVLYFIFQAVLIPISCLRRSPNDEGSNEWTNDIKITLSVIEDMNFIHSSKCAAVVHGLVDSLITPLTRQDTPPTADPREQKIDSIELADSWSQIPNDGVVSDIDLLLDARHLENDPMHDAWEIMWPGVPSSVEQTPFLEDNVWSNENSLDD